MNNTVQKSTSKIFKEQKTKLIKTYPKIAFISAISRSSASTQRLSHLQSTSKMNPL